jgi:MFS family permease
MQATTNNLSMVAHVIQLAVAPVFLLTGVGAILSVLINRLGRIVDRYRCLNDSVEYRNSRKKEIEILSGRARLIHWAISLCTICALFICIVIAALFVGSETGMDPSRVISILFIAAMLALIAGLLCFLREIALTTGKIEVDIIESRK